MTSDIALAPLLPVWLIVALAVPTLLLLAVALVRRARGGVLRAGALAALVLALLDPRLVRDETQARPDVALVVIDQSASQSIGGRSEAAEAAAARIAGELGQSGDLEVRTIRTGRSDTGETRLFGAIENAVLENAAGRLAGVFVISDGQIHDVPQPGSASWLTAPVHLLLTGAKDERDRRITVEQAPAYGLVDHSVDIAFRVDELGPAAGAGARARVHFRLDGDDAGTSMVPVGTSQTFSLTLRHPGPTVLELEVDPAEGEVSALNNRTAVVVNGVRDRLRVLLVSGQPHPGERMWRNLLKADPGVDLVHFTILRPPEKDDATPLRELSLIVFPVQELFETKLKDFDLIVLDRYAVRGILPTPYYAHIADYVRAGGALLLAVGPEFAGVRSLHRTPLDDILPAKPTGRILEQAFRPQVTSLGHRHPVTSGLPGETVAGDADLEEASAGPTWGRWFRLIESETRAPALLADASGRPLLVVDRVGEGRVGELLSDQIWLWGRGYEGGGPASELLRRLAHWLMKEPELEEEHLAATVENGRLRIERRSLDEADSHLTVTSPSGVEQVLTLSPGRDGIARADIPADEAGLWRVADSANVAFAAAGRLNPPELADLRASAAPMTPLVQATGGGIAWLADGLPAFRRISPGRSAAGAGWMGLQRNHAETVTGHAELPLLPVLFVLAATLGGLAGAWWREGR